MKKKQLTADQQRLVVENMDFATDLAKSFAPFLCNKKIEKTLEVADLEQESLYGLCIAAGLYNTESETEFKTYAFPWCIKYIKKALHQFSTPLTLSERIKDNIEVLHLDLIFEAMNTEDGDDGTDADRLFYGIAMEEDAEREYNEALGERIDKALLVLTPKEQTVIKRTYGLDGEEELSRNEIAELMNVTPGRVTQIRERALRKMEMANVA